MLVNLYTETDAEPYARAVDLAECFPDQPEEAAIAETELLRAGRYWAGGGAAERILLVRADR